METQLSPDRTLEDVVRDLDRDAVGDLDHDAIGNLLDSPREPTCEVHLGRSLDAPLCGRPAAWLTKASCGHSAYYCAPCRKRVKAQLDKRDAAPACPLHPRPVPITIELVKL